MPQYKLKYFDLRGRGEAARQIFALASVEFEDVRIPRDAWPKQKDQTPFGQLPVLEVDGVQLAQSTAIARFLGKSFNFAGKTPEEDARLDMLVDQANDFSSEIRPFFAVLLGFAEGDKAALKAEKFIPARDKHFALLSKFLNGESFILGDNITWADVYIAEYFNSLSGLVPDAFDGFPGLVAYKQRVQANPKIRKHLATRPDAPF